MTSYPRISYHLNCVTTEVATQSRKFDLPLAILFLSDALLGPKTSLCTFDSKDQVKPNDLDSANMFDIVLGTLNALSLASKLQSTYQHSDFAETKSPRLLSQTCICF